MRMLRFADRRGYGDRSESEGFYVLAHRIERSSRKIQISTIPSTTLEIRIEADNLLIVNPAG